VKLFHDSGLWLKTKTILINLRHDVDRHENDLDRQADDIRKLETFKDDMKTLVQVVEYMWTAAMTITLWQPGVPPLARGKLKVGKTSVAAPARSESEPGGIW